VPVSTDLDQMGDRGGVLGYGQAGNRAMDLDMSNVEEISVLRGAAATALYGSRAAAGAVVIRTRQGRPGQALRWDISSSMTFDRPIIGGYTTDYTAGSFGYFCNGHIEAQGGWCQPGFPGLTTPGPMGVQNWGPHKDSIPQIVFDHVGPVRLRDAREDYYQTARSMENTVRASGALGDEGAFTFGVSHLDQRDITPQGKLERLNMSGNLSLRLSSFLRSNTSVQRIATHNPWVNDSWVSVHRSLILVPPSVDISQTTNPDGNPVMWGVNSPHPDWLARNEYEESNVDRWIVSQRLAATILPGLTLSNNIGLDTYQDYRRSHRNERPWQTAQGLPSGNSIQEVIDRRQINNDLVLSLDAASLGETGFRVSGLVGHNVFMSDNKFVRGIGRDIVIPDFYNIVNFARQEVRANLPVQRRLMGVYGQATLDYNHWAYLTLTGRNDWSSTLPTHANSYFYPSASLGLVFTEALNWHSDWLPYGKLRFSLSRVGNDAPPYSLSSRYFGASLMGHFNSLNQFAETDYRIQFPFRGQTGFMQGTALGNPDIKPEATTETEVGLELRLLQNRVRLDGSYYNKKSYDQIFPVPVTPSTGYTSMVRNAGDLRNEGVELSLHARPVQTQNFSWDVRANWTRNRNSVIELAEGVTNIHLAGYSWPSIRIMEGHAYGVIWGYGFQRNCVEATTNICFPDQPEGALLIGDVNTPSDRGGSANGFPLRTNHQFALAEAFPNWLGNLSTELRYRGLGLSGMLDIRNGSKILNFETQYNVTNGRSILTNDRGQATVVEGINVNTGQPNSYELVKDARYYDLMYGYDRHEAQIEPGGFVKLREVTLFYDVPTSLTERLLNVQRATVFVSGRNLAVWSDFSMGDPESDLYGGVNAAGQFFRQYPAPQTRGVTMGIRASF
jgi:TonB-linked SusC/RagA family outer membrane protein